MSQLALPDSFEYLCYGSTAIRNILLFQYGDRLKSSQSDVYGRQILTTKVDPHAVFKYLVLYYYIVITVDYFIKLFSF